MHYSQSFSFANGKSSNVVIFQSTMVAQMFLQMPQMSICLVCYKVKIMEVISINFAMMFLFLQTCSEEVYFCFCLLSENTHYLPQGTMLESTLNSGGVLSRCRHFSEFKRAYLMFHLPLIHIKVIISPHFHLYAPISTMQFLKISSKNNFYFLRFQENRKKIRMLISFKDLMLPA